VFCGVQCLLSPSPVPFSLSRRFTILRSAGDPTITAESLKARFADQRARGAVNQVTEEEEDMLLETLGFRNRVSSATATSDDQHPADLIFTSRSNPSSSPRYNKRNSNNLFGSGKLRDYTYLRSVQTKQSPRVQSSQLASLAEKPGRLSPTHKTALSAPLQPPGPYAELPLSPGGEHRGLASSALRRMSMALEEAIGEMEEEAEDEIVLPRSAPISRISFDKQKQPTTEPVR
jgi:serine/arginine repetitive matrix protein 2